METSHSVLRFAKRFFAGTILSRVSGALRDVAMAICFGSAPEIGAFMVAYRLANLFRRLLGEGSMQAGFIPHFSSLQGKDSFFFFRDSLFSLLVFLVCMSLGLEAFLWGIIPFFSEDWAEIIRLSMRMVPGLVFICLYALNSALLQAQKRYFISGFAPVVFNLCWIFIALLAHRYPLPQAMRFLSCGITVSFALQWALTAIQVHQAVPLSWREWFSPHLFSLDWKKMIKPLSLGVIGVGAVQLNSALDAIFSRVADLSGPAYLWYAIRIQQLPLALFGIALSGALLPSLSRAVTDGAIERYRGLLHKALRHSASLLIPCTFGLFALGFPGIQLLYGHGDFLDTDVAQTVYCLWGYAPGLLPSIFVLLMASGFYAQKSYKIPAISAVVSVIFHVGMNSLLIFGFHLGAFSIALSTSAASFVNAALLAYFLRSKMPESVFLGFFPFALRLCGAGVIACIATLSLRGLPFLGEGPHSLLFQIAQFSALGTVFIATFIALVYWMRIEEFFEIFAKNKSESPV